MPRKSCPSKPTNKDYSNPNQVSVYEERKGIYWLTSKVWALVYVFTPFASLSTQDRETLERSQQVAAQSRTTDGTAQDPHATASGSVAASTVANHPVNHMEVDELERELSGHM